jgi:hypothetical protein
MPGNFIRLFKYPSAYDCTNSCITPLKIAVMPAEYKVMNSLFNDPPDRLFINIATNVAPISTLDMPPVIQRIQYNGEVDKVSTYISELATPIMPYSKTIIPAQPNTPRYLSCLLSAESDGLNASPPNSMFNIPYNITLFLSLMFRRS